MSQIRPVRTLCIVALATAFTALGCNRPASGPEPPAPERIAVPSLGIAFSALPIPFAVETNSEEGLVLTAGKGARVDLEAADPSAGSDVVAAAKSSQDDFAAMPGGTFEGGTKLGTPFGMAYTVRGSFDEEGARIEERRVFMPHPDGSGRLLIIRYRYPAGDLAAARERFQQTLVLMNNLELETAVSNAG